MNRSEVFLKIEEACEALELKNSYGEIIPGCVSVGRVMVYHDGKWESNMAALEDGRMSDEDYLAAQLALVDQYRKHLTLIRFQRRLNG